MSNTDETLHEDHDANRSDAGNGERRDHLATLGLMLGSVSHGVKGLLTALEGGVYLLEAGVEQQDLEKVKGATASVKETVTRVKSLVQNILYYAKSPGLRLEKVDIPTLARQAAATVEHRAKDHGVALECVVADGAGEMEADGHGLAASLVNLLDNAIDSCAMDNREQSHNVSLKAGPDGDGVCFEVCDNGQGMDKETRDKLFTLFFTSKGSQGTGLGLFIAGDVVARHAGVIEVESEPGKGARFLVRLPRRPAGVGVPA